MTRRVQKSGNMFLRSGAMSANIESVDLMYAYVDLSVNYGTPGRRGEGLIIPYYPDFPDSLSSQNS